MVLYIEHQSPSTSTSTSTSSQPTSYNQPSKPFAISPLLRNKRRRSHEFQSYKRIKNERPIISEPELPLSTFQQPKNGILHQKPLGHFHTAELDNSQVSPVQSNITLNAFRPITPPPQMSQLLEFEPSPSCEAENYMLEGYNVRSNNSSTTTVDHRDPMTDSDENVHDCW